MLKYLSIVITVVLIVLLSIISPYVTNSRSGTINGVCDDFGYGICENVSTEPACYVNIDEIMIALKRGDSVGGYKFISTGRINTYKIVRTAVYKERNTIKRRSHRRTK